MPADFNPKKQTRVVYLLLPAIAAIIATAVFVWSRLSVEHLDAEARDLASAAASNKPDLLYDHAFEREIEAEHLTRDNWRSIWNTLIQPRLAKFKSHGQMQTALYGDGSEGVASLPVSDAAGHKWEIDVNLWGTDDRGRLLLNGYLMASWVFEYAISKGDNTFAGIWTAKLKGLRHDRASLERLGMRAWVILDPKHGGVRVESLDTLDARLAKTIAVAKSGSYR